MENNNNNNKNTNPNNMNIRLLITGMITNITHYGVFVKFANGFSGLCHISEVSDSFVENISDYFKIGENYEFLVLSINKERQQYKLSYKALHPSERNKKSIFRDTASGFEPLEKLIHEIDSAEISNENLISEES